jgi:transcription elongation GreA/GreB family factor
MSTSSAKARLLRALVEHLAGEIASAEASQRAAREDAVHPETVAEDPKDTRAIEAGYLARGLAERVETLRRAHEMLAGLELRVFHEDTPIAATALVSLEDESDGEALRVFLLPLADGSTIVAEECTARAISPVSPLGRALVGRCAGESVEVRAPAGSRNWIIAAVE